ncbi:nuclear transport factor 2B [Phoenix dactylifera]|uniref:NTF2-related export protein n=1 Tax=Phoenix dactylifera TaxID=42345 RepID=A0A8B7CNW5_PHODC|nr:nuclear transport factor 2B [Phoenix dactylifera]
MDKEEKMGVEDQLEMVAKAFVNHYYHLFDTNRAALAPLYHHTSMLSFEGQKIQGAEEIGQKLAQLPFEHCRHFISTIDSQPSPFGGGILVFVSGNLQLQGEEHQLKFSQMFQLIPTQHGSFFVQNDMFRLNYG